MLVLGIESSCDETAAAVVDGSRPAGERILSNIVFSQWESVRKYGGVVPEVAARAHVEKIDQVVDRALDEAGVPIDALDGIAATAGPGLIGGVIVGVSYAKALAMGADKPFMALNHLEGHALTPRLVASIEFPFLLLLVSGGHCQTLLVEGVGKYRRLGTTIDDAIGEAFDKTAKLMELGQPGGPAVEALAAQGDPRAVPLPVPFKGRPGLDFSFSGLKTAVRRAVQGDAGYSPEDIAASFQRVAFESLIDRTRRAAEAVALAVDTPLQALVVAGGVAANRALSRQLTSLGEELGLPVVVPPAALCTDNGAMMAWAGVERLRAGNAEDQLAFAPRPRWPLDPDAPKSTGAGAAKA
ncbi:MAG: tRNA (adenosine(37)-N6)-threonylcarbamoyltransferase complex transferase subunit TsaD [Kiloniella sp.]|nr:tRNA (adenosine(37)-N6)-threonylcarbamoyltransferase complex transferase subunit TsaD [Kiloniella sp.]RZO31626.1 MAG: tRNA (adenosine(37)-N6)-threonylcarbamoyltransferase complex transferase subunit TsaD [Rhodospirillaceae bacterium]